MASIFLSYAREDAATAERIAKTLEDAGHSVWWDRQLHAGSRFNTEIEAALRQADLVMVLWSKSSVDSAWVHDEAAAGRDSGRLVPVLIDAVEPPLGFRQYQAVRVVRRRGQNDAALRGLAAAVAQRLGAAAVTPKPERRRFEWLQGRRGWVAGATLLLVIAAAAIALLVVRPGRADAEPASLAVLPFKNMSAGDPYFAEGVAEEILNQLAREPQFKVAGRTSSALFKDAADMRDVGRRLHVTYVLEGSVRSAGSQVRVDVALVDARKGMRLWSQDFRGSLDDIFAIQENIGKQVATHVRRQLVDAGQPTDHLTTSGEVYSLTVTARSLMHTREPSKIDAAIDLLRRAVKTDPNYAPAWARLALALALYEAYKNSEDAPPLSSEDERIRYAQRAVALAPSLAEGHAILGLMLLGNGDFDVAKTDRGRGELQRAISLNPNDAQSWYWLYDVRTNQLDFDRALNALRRSARIDPFFPLIGEYFPRIAWDMGYRTEAIRFLDDRIANHPDPFIRELALSIRARLQNDQSGAYEYAKKAREIALPDHRPVAEFAMGAVLLHLRLYDEAERFVAPPIVDMRRGKLTFSKGLRGAFPSALDFWREMAEEPHLLPRLLVKLGRSADLVAVYDEAFSSPQNMAARYPHPAFVEDAPMLAVALQRAGRVREGSKILLLGDGMCRRGIQGEHTPIRFRVSCSRLWAVLGHKDQAIQTLEQAVREGWRPGGGEYPLVGEEPAYAGIRNEPRIERIDAMLGAEIARERRELLAAGL